ncbi:hypothetical protein M501DRAFT_1000543 [Patellaria atrata CBS 101060]|uniref:Uncharacterized protein n=1 Tax=Patellaria atrata CBS 101060 TaxID=1346257 RepID=A0A9P4VV77_9PEZI|nr:hypothetical protein M501DRAFT_1000543 [Patellaria atrata CBS 101060]
MRAWGDRIIVTLASSGVHCGVQVEYSRLAEDRHNPKVIDQKSSDDVLQQIQRCRKDYNYHFPTFLRSPPSPTPLHMSLSRAVPARALILNFSLLHPP